MSRELELFLIPLITFSQIYHGNFIFVTIITVIISSPSNDCCVAVDEVKTTHPLSLKSSGNFNDLSERPPLSLY